MTPLQEGMLLHTLRHPASAVYRGQCSTTLNGPLDEARLRAAWQHLIRRHQALRSFFAWEGREKPLQVVRESVELPWRALDWSDRPASEQAEAWSRLLEDDEREPYDLTVAPLMRLTLVRIGAHEHRLLWSVHHALADGWSGFLVLREMIQRYDELGSGPAKERPEPPSFARFVTWLDERDHAAAETFWRRHLAGMVDATDLKLTREGSGSSKRHTLTHALPADVSERFLAVTTDLRVTPNTVAVAAWALVLARHQFDAADVTFGVTTSERPAEIPDVAESVGLYLSSVPVRIGVDDEQPVATWLRSIQDVVNEARHHSAGGLADISRWAELAPGGSVARSLVVYESFPAEVVKPPEDGGLTLGETEIAAPSDLPVALLVYPGDEVVLHLVYDPALYEDDEAARLLRQTSHVVASLLDPSAGTVGDIGLSETEPTAAARHEVDAAAPPVQDVLERFEEIVQRRPDAVAVCDADGSITYGELDRAANRRARTLLSRAWPRGLVAIPADRDRSTVTSVLAALKAGVGYTLVDPDQPASRLDQMLAHVDAVLTSGADTRWTSDLCVLDEDSTQTDAKPEPSLEADGVAYVVWTSGSTGEPKGVVVGRDHLARSTAARLEYYRDRPMESFLLLSSMSVDSSVAGLYGTLSGGGRLVLPGARAEQDVVGLARLVVDAEVTATLLVPSLYSALLESSDPEDLVGLRTVIVAGEACPDDLLVEHRSRLPGAALFNEYGPSEATVWATAIELTHRDRVTIGRPVPFVTTYVLDAHGRPMPTGAAGEICIGGGTVARGYLSDPERTDARFVPDPFVPGGRMYRTGDRGRLDAGGVLHFLGRIDDQIKLRGFRVEPGEIESALTSHPDVREAGVTLTRSPTNGRQQLAAAFVSDRADLDPAALREHVRTRVPAYMVPTVFGRVSRLPRTAAGKLDRRALEGIVDGPVGATTSGRAPSSEAERAWAAIWEDVLGVERVSVDDDFFAIGGDSLLSIRVMARAAQAGFPVTPAGFFRGPTIAQLVAHDSAPATDAEQGTVEGGAPLTPIQHWFLATVTEGRDRWNQSRMWTVPDWVDEDVAVEALRRLLAHHDALRTTIADDGDGARQDFGAPPTDVPFVVVELPPGGEEGLHAAAERAHDSIRLGSGPVVQMVLFRGPDRPGSLLVVAHHLVVDALSWGVIAQDLGALLVQARDATAHPLPAKTTSVRSWSEGLAAASTVSDPQPWIELCRRAPASLFEPVPNTEKDVRRRSLVFDASTTATLLDTLGPKLDARPEALLLGAVLLAWRRATGLDDLLVDVEGHGRDALDVDVSRTVGWFSVTAPRVLHLERDSVERAVAVARASLGDISGQRGLPGRLRYLHPERRVRESLAVMPPVLFNYLSLVEDSGAAVDILTPVREPDVQARSPEAPRGYLVDVNARIEGGRLIVDVDAPTGLRTAEGLVDMAEAIREAIEALADGTKDDGPRLDLVGLDDASLARVADMLSRVDDG